METLCRMPSVSFKKKGLCFALKYLLAIFDDRYITEPIGIYLIEARRSAIKRVLKNDKFTFIL